MTYTQTLETKAARIFGHPIVWADLTIAEKRVVLAAIEAHVPQPTGKVYTFGAGYPAIVEVR